MILVTGAEGQLGSELKKFYSNQEAFFTNSMNLNITKFDLLNKFINNNNISAIINAAAYTNVDKAEKEKHLCFNVNVKGVDNLSRLCKKKNIPLIHISTDYVFDGTSSSPYKENDPTNPISFYGKSKLESEAVFMKNISIGAIIRTSWLYSEYGNNFVKTILKLANNEKQLNIINDQIGTPTYAYDLAKIIHMILPKLKNCTREIYHFSNDSATSWYDFACEIVMQKKIKCKIEPIKTKDYPLLAKRPHYSVFNKAKIKKAFNIEIRPWKKALKECLTKLF